MSRIVDNIYRRDPVALGRKIGKALAHWIWFAVGFVWGRYGFVDAAVVFGGAVVALFALYGAIRFDWSKDDD